jgi:hypothetical protein
MVLSVVKLAIAIGHAAIIDKTYSGNLKNIVKNSMIPN